MISNRQLSTVHCALRVYFRSGWAFLIPYLAAYLLYASLKWPVNPADGADEIVKEASGSESMVHGPWSFVPCLLHVYWALHALHLILGVLALHSWWKGSGVTVTGATDDGNKTTNREVLSQQSTVRCLPSGMDRLWPVMPWLCLALLFYIPGIYLEWPSDPWEHYLRINEWHWPANVTNHSTWEKSSYFLGYSFIGHVESSIVQLKWLDLYYTGCCLLLCWQYFLLARAAALEKRASYIFVLLQALLLGNNLFGFYRYYGASSSLFSLLGAIAIVRIALVAACFHLPLSLPARALPDWARTAGSCILLLTLTAFNHVQGISIAGLGVCAVISARLIAWRRSTGWWLAGATLGLSVAVIVGYPRSATLDEVYRPQGWLTAWYGFNLLPSSPAFARVETILGTVGLLNLAAGAWLLARNHVVGWLTLFPILALCLPCVALPFASVLSTHGPDGIVTFHRPLLGIPAGLALVTLGMWAFKLSDAPGAGASRFGPGLVYAMILISGLGLCLVPAGNPSFNRTYNALMRTPADLTMGHVLIAVDDLGPVTAAPTSSPAFVGSAGVSYLNYSTGRRNDEYPWQDRSINLLPQEKNTLAQTRIISLARSHRPVVFLPQWATQLFTPASPTGFLSGHWPANFVAFEHTGVPEVLGQTRPLGFRENAYEHSDFIVFP